MSLHLEAAHIKNFKSLEDVSLSFRDLTILVGCNASGKSNSLEALYFLKYLLVNEDPLSPELMRRIFRFGSQDDPSFTIVVKDRSERAEYNVSVSNNLEVPIFSQESLMIGQIKVIDIVNGKGQVFDEDGLNDQKYMSKAKSLALRSAGNFGDKPLTFQLSEFMRNWEFYNLDPEQMRDRGIFLMIPGNSRNIESLPPSLDSTGNEIQNVLKYWAKNDENKFQAINEELYDCLGLQLKLVVEKEEKREIIKVTEKDSLEVPLSSMSDGTLRIIAYLTLLYQAEIPPLVGIEEPERNLHPGILMDVTSIIKRLSKKTQVVITTHSSQLLDCFNIEDISSSVSVLLLSKRNSYGTKAYPLEKLGQEREALYDWMSDFGVGSAIYHSNLLQELLEN